MNNIIKKYSKSSNFYIEAKQELFQNNDELLKAALKKNEKYCNQPIRKECKICFNKLKKNPDFVSHKVPYVFCEQCNHLNGLYEDTRNFYDSLYTRNDGEEYSKDYKTGDYLQRTANIYAPKVDFLIESIPNIMNSSILDLGCGCGYFVNAALDKNIDIVGFDVNRKMVDYGNSFINRIHGQEPLKFFNEVDIFESIKSQDAELISAIGVLEHMMDLTKFTNSYLASQSKYLYYSVPMFSMSAILENVFSEILPRQLSEGHTHLFTERSINKFNQIIHSNSIAEWRFGTDILDLYRSLKLNLIKNNSSEDLISYFNSGFQERIDDIQNLLDKNHFCSEIHCVVLKD